MEDQLAAAGGRVDLLGQAAEADPPFVEVSQRLNKVWEGAPEAIESPDDKRVARANEVEGFL